MHHQAAPPCCHASSQQLMAPWTPHKWPRVRTAFGFYCMRQVTCWRHERPYRIVAGLMTVYGCVGCRTLLVLSLRPHAAPHACAQLRTCVWFPDPMCGWSFLSIFQLSGNEAVLRARFEDATFFYREDLKTPLDQLRCVPPSSSYHSQLLLPHSSLIRSFQILPCRAAMYNNHQSILLARNGLPPFLSLLCLSLSLSVVCSYVPSRLVGS